MQFISCRAEEGKDECYDVSWCVLGSYARDGGMLLPQHAPPITQQMLSEWATLTQQQLFANFLALFLPSIPPSTLISMLCGAFSDFDGSLDVCDESAFLRCHTLKPHQENKQQNDAPPLHILELWHGPTLAFKDIPLQFLSQCMSHYLSLRPSPSSINVLVGTSGDTGSAAIQAVINCPAAHIYVLYPAGARISSIQERQMTTVCHPRVHVVGVDGTSDELDVPILRCFQHEKFKNDMNLVSINSVNVMRILVQCAHFVYAYLSVLNRSSGLDLGMSVDVSVPSGACGHLVSACLCKRMGLPLGRIVVATNANSLLADFVNTGRFQPQQTAIRTNSPAIDIQMPYNIERLLYLALPGDHYEKTAQVRSCLSSLNAEGSFQLTPTQLAAFQQLQLVGVSVSDAQVCSEIARVWKQHDYLLDPHTAVGAVAAQHITHTSNSNAPMCVFSTAHAAKFSDTVRSATGMSAQAFDDLLSSSPFRNVRAIPLLASKPTHSLEFRAGDDWEQRLKHLIVQSNPTL